MKQLLFNLGRAAGVYALTNRLTRRSLRVLCYHGLWVTPGYEFGDRLFIPPRLFDRRMKRLSASGRPVLPLGEALARLQDGSLPSGAAAITIDDGWAATPIMADTLARYGLPATLYMTTWYMERQAPIPNKTLEFLTSAAATAVEPPSDLNSRSAEEQERALLAYSEAVGVPLDWYHRRQFHLMTPAELEEVRAKGLDIQLHTHRHKLGEDVVTELADNRDALVRAGVPGNSLSHFCFPSGILREDVRGALEKFGVVSATTCESGLTTPETDPYNIPRFLDGRSVSDAEFDGFLSGFVPLMDDARARLRG
ncbi:hypothetical protein B5C34_00925 [Pacificimonas flava]|uniref:Chitooligosaccharide deacetylase n=2 Tax=Pacificimonas TaxID=1960290 RepID=A0A219B1E9_9SPHN|nr:MULTISPECIES: polysaccharide deacetylase family protein [Pacificimonas]MBZ6378224.1 polysaccharide deacetylase family protein [Pacificimonas aurantium]OWV32150.1 hypothetical protein B5C34_00925 [Pacificimonas flava]